ncbi:hypothetical protein [Hymenobacter rigui]|uniref:Uncharacterized protein n=1 Tax=Hymenobacter rigui TaxID=334424 RepID=A0A428K9V1_9BACT|nr:hypothetical protein [Hymenobacter rigui]RSK43152.1 hypothetical protein EI291_22080 [Hymenobacter rigui]
MRRKRFSDDDELEDAGLIQSMAPTEDELREISLFIAESKRRWASQLQEGSQTADEGNTPQKKDE